MKHLLLCIYTALFLFLLPAAGAATVRLQISGDADEPISEGRNYNLLYDSDRGSLVYVNYPTAGTVLEFNLWYNVTGEETTSLLGFTTVGLGTPLVTGTYDNATSVHFAHVYPHLNPVPEPSAATLLGALALGALGWRRRRR